MPGLVFRLVRRRAHHPGDLHAGDERWLEPQLVFAAQQQQVGEADPGRTDVDDNNILAADIIDVGVDQSGGAGEFLRDKRFHRTQPRLNVARCAADRSVISPHFAAMSSTEGTSEKVMPSFWNSAVRWTLPPPTMNTEAVSGSSSVIR